MNPPAHAVPAQAVTIDIGGEGLARLLGILGVAAIAVVHLLDAADTYQSTRYIFWLYMVIVVAAAPLITLFVQWRSPEVWLAALALAAGPFVGYLWSRSIGLPGDPGDVGNWLDTLGMTSLFLEGALISLCVARLSGARLSGRFSTGQRFSRHGSVAGKETPDPPTFTLQDPAARQLPGVAHLRRESHGAPLHNEPMDRARRTGNNRHEQPE
jgi:hypothetical protein